MELGDEYQDMGNPGPIQNMPLGDHHQTESPMSQEDLSDPDLQDEESGEELLQQPLQGNAHPSTGNPQNESSAPTALSHLNSMLHASHPHLLSKYKMDPSEMDLLNNKSSLEALQAAMSSGGFNLPFSFPPPSAFLAPHHNNHQQISGGGVTSGGGGGGGNNSGGGTGSNNAIASSASSLSSESSQGSLRNVSEAREGTGQSQNSNSNNSQQQSTSWSFEEQFKQVRQLYEINDDPKRKEFLDDLFSFMQKRGTPINRLPIMAKSVLDLYELYNLVIARGGLVDVINKKLWQEIIKGLHLPSSITSAAFTLRTQYMKYLYPYECDRQQLSTQLELQAAIDGNRREGRRSSYGAYPGPGVNESMIQRNSHTPTSGALHTQMSPLSLVTTVGGHHLGPQSMMNGNGALNPMTHHSLLPSHAQFLLGPPNSVDFDSRMAEYVKLINKELRGTGGGSPPPSLPPPPPPPAPITNRQSGAVSPSETPPRDSALSALEFSRMTLWNMYNNNGMYPNIGHHTPISPHVSHSPHTRPSSPEQREALDLGLRSSPNSTSPNRHSPITGINLHHKREHDIDSCAPPPLKRSLFDDDVNNVNDKSVPTFAGTHIKISNRGDNKTGDNSLVVSMELNGVMYQGVLFAQADNKSRANATNNNTKSRSVLL